MKKIIRFVFAFLYVRNWYTGHYELSSIRVLLFTGLLLFLAIGFGITLLLQAPVEYTRVNL